MRVHNSVLSKATFALQAIRIRITTLCVIDSIDETTRVFKHPKTSSRWPPEVRNFKGAIAKLIGTGVQGKASVSGDVHLDFCGLTPGNHVLRLEPAEGAWLRPYDRKNLAPVGPDDNHGDDGPGVCRYRPLDVRVSIAVEGDVAKVSRAEIDPKMKHGAVCIDSAGRLVVDWKPDWVAYGGISTARVKETVQLIILHNTSASSIGSSINVFLYDDKGIHYVVDKDGFTVKMAPDEVEVGHAGYSFWGGEMSLNRRSIGIEHVHAKGEEYTNAQMSEAIRLIRAIRRAYPAITRHNVLAHADVNTTGGARYVPKAKPDCPGVEYDWKRLRSEGLVTAPRTPSGASATYGGYFVDNPESKIERHSGKDVKDASLKNSKGVPYGVVQELQKDLKRIGYSINSKDGVTVTGTYDEATSFAVDRFQRRFLPQKTPKGDSIGKFDKETAIVLKEVLEDHEPCGNCEECVSYELNEPFLIATAKDRNIKTRVSLAVNDDILKGARIDLGQDAQHSKGRSASDSYSVGKDEEQLKNQMRKLVDVFAAEDSENMACRLFERFLKKNREIEIFHEDSLDRAVEKHENMIAFTERALAAPGTPGVDPGKRRIHQALMDAGWNINHAERIDDLGVPAFNKGLRGNDAGQWSEFVNGLIKTKDYTNGLKIMINSVQYVFVFVEDYRYRSCDKQYTIELKYVIYDVFGLDDDDLRVFGASGDTGRPASMIGFTAWWQLQHQFDYAPLLTKAVVKRSFTVKTPGT
jgi:N-acetyl-anhydromuramyl-L-alanine amidase AmpD